MSRNEAIEKLNQVAAEDFTEYEFCDAFWFACWKIACTSQKAPIISQAFAPIYFPFLWTTSSCISSIFGPLDFNNAVCASDCCNNPLPTVSNVFMVWMCWPVRSLTIESGPSPMPQGTGDGNVEQGMSVT